MQKIIIGDNLFTFAYDCEKAIKEGYKITHLISQSISTNIDYTTVKGSLLAVLEPTQDECLKTIKQI